MVRFRESQITRLGTESPRKHEQVQRFPENMIRNRESQKT